MVVGGMFSIVISAERPSEEISAFAVHEEVRTCPQCDTGLRPRQAEEAARVEQQRAEQRELAELRAQKGARS